jgi:hypothetical protein
MDLFECVEDSTLQVFKSFAEPHPALLTVCNRHGDFLIHHAVRKSNTSILGYPLGKGASPSLPGAYGSTTLPAQLVTWCRGTRGLASVSVCSE